MKIKDLFKKYEAEIIETRRMVNGWEQYTGNYRLIGNFPGDYVNLPGHGGRVTRLAAINYLRKIDGKIS